MDLVEFLRSRLDDEAAVAQKSYDEAGDYRLDGSMATQLHFANWKPDRVLADVEAKRRIVGSTAHPPKAWSVFDDGFRRGQMAAHDDVLRLLALPYATHPDYREEWRP